jgi:hypothetical protein
MKLISEIRSKAGVLHFRRYALFQCVLFNIYIHRIFKDDQDTDPHDHPWNFWSIILWGSVIEDTLNKPATGVKSVGSCRFVSTKDFHKNRIITPVTTFVITGKRTREWGYMTDNGWVDHKTYRKLKNKTGN